MAEIDFEKLFGEIKSNPAKQYMLLLLECNSHEPVKDSNRFMMEMFLISLKVPHIKWLLEFEPDYYGPVSEVLLGYIDDMAKMKLINADKKSRNVIYSLGQYGEKFLNENAADCDIKLISEVKSLCSDISDDELVCLTYFSFPKMTCQWMVEKRITGKREKLAGGLYKKGKVSFKKSLEIADLSEDEFLEFLKDF